MFPLLEYMGVDSIPWSPLAGGRVARPWGDNSSTSRGSQNPESDRNGRPLFLDSDKDVVDAVPAVAEARGVSMATVGLAWVLKNPVVAAPIVGATKEKHLTDAAAALDIELTVDELVRLGEPYLIREPTYF